MITYRPWKEPIFFKMDDYGSNYVYFDPRVQKEVPVSLTFLLDWPVEEMIFKCKGELWVTTTTPKLK